MTKFYSRLLLGMLGMVCSVCVLAQVNVTATGGTAAATYTTLKTAFDAINAGTHQGTITVTITGNVTETLTAALNASEAPASYTAVNIGTSGTFTVSGNIAGALVHLNGADNVTINGSNTLTFSNTNGNTISLTNDASNNTIRNVTIIGTSNVTTSGVIFFGASTTTGNDNNLVENCDIDGANSAVIAIMSSVGTVTTLAAENSNNIIRGNRIHDFVNPAVTTSIGIALSAGNTGWTIENNSIYHSAPVNTSLQYVLRGILVLPNFVGDTHIIRGNFVGGNAPNAAGTLDIAATGTNVVGFIGIDVETAGTGNLVENNTVRNVTLTYNSNAGSFGNAGIFVFIPGFSGETTVTGNTITNLSYTNNNGAMLVQALHANSRIGDAGSILPELTISNNSITNITAISGGTNSAQLYGMRLETSSAASLTTAAINNPLFTVTGNTITNLSGPAIGTNTFVKGIGTIGTQGGSGTTLSIAALIPEFNIASNTISNLNSTSMLASYSSPAVVGIHVTGSTQVAGPDQQKISQNTIFNLNAQNNGDVGTTVMGILVTNSLFDINRNKIYDLSNASTGATTNAGIVGISVRNVLAASAITNNFVSLGTGETTNLRVVGIINNLDAAGPLNVQFNSVVVTGAGAAGNNKQTAAFARGAESFAATTAIVTPVNLRNNIFYNARTGGGTHVAVANVVPVPATAWTSASNNLYSSTAATIALWGTTSNTLGAYAGNTSDVTSKSVTVSFADIANGDLHLTGASVSDINLNGVPITGITIDIDGDTRDATAPKIGADEAFSTCVVPTITTEPLAATACQGSAATFTVVAAGTGLTYQWNFNGAPINGATAATLTINAAAAADAGNYSVTVTNACGNVTTTPVALTVNNPPTIVTQPVNRTECTGASATFTVAATGSNLTYQWRKNGTDIGGATGATLTLNNLTAADAANYTVLVSSGTCSVVSSAVSLTVNGAPTITTQPAALTRCFTQSATFTVAASGTGLTYQWKKNGADINNATTATLTLNNVGDADAANYTVVVTGNCGSVTSTPAALTVTACTSVPNVDTDVNSMVLMPNAVRHATVLRVNAVRAMKIQFNVVDMTGRVVMTLDRQVHAGQNDIRIEMGHLSTGTYQVTGETGKGRTETLRLVRY